MKKDKKTCDETCTCGCQGGKECTCEEECSCGCEEDCHCDENHSCDDHNKDSKCDCSK